MFNVISPDGFPFNFEPIDTKEQAEKTLDNFVERYKFQGYYSKSNRERIPVEELKKHCKIEEIN